ncbi:unnamed protein product [Orchesella dallaii]|uniref:Uncharacterized protein n=1 Tax=Orchesella dallaii TaxID=48710 RepID=A0ABP1QS78_9HEXA
MSEPSGNSRKRSKTEDEMELDNTDNEGDKSRDMRTEKLGNEDKVIGNLTERIVNLEEKGQLETENTRLHQQSNNLNLIIGGIEEVKDETAGILLYKNATGLKKLKQDVKIDAHFRLGKTMGNKNRPVKVRFETMRDRNYVWEDRRTVNPTVRANRYLLIQEGKKAKEKNTD